MSATQPVRVLTVGEGDLSYSLALARAFGDRIELTATTLPDEEELRRTYSAAGRCIDELRERGAKVVHGMDATALDASGLGLQDHICFLHPHLGLSDLLDEAAHAHRHSVLVAHYLSSAMALLTPGRGVVSLTLCGNQAETWRCEAHAARLSLSIVQRLSTTHHSCFFPPGAEQLEPTPHAAPEWAARRKFRSGALGTKHWAGRFGYEHRRCEGDTDMHVDSSVEILFVPAPAPLAPAEVEAVTGERCSTSRSGGGGAARCCRACGVKLADGEDPSAHVRSLATPHLTPSERAFVCGETGRAFRTEFELESYRKQQAHLEEARQRQPKQKADAVARAAAAAESALADARARAAAAVAAEAGGGGQVGTSDGRQGAEEEAFTRVRHCVPLEGEGQRAFNWARRGAFPRQLQSKKQAQQAFKEGRVLLCGAAVEETRVLHSGDELTLLHDKLGAQRAQLAGKLEAPIVVHEIGPSWAVVWKPAGMRACGDFPGTLQSALRLLLPPSAEPPPPADATTLAKGPMPVSRLEMGCTGLTMVARTQALLDGLIACAQRSELHHTFVALVHGRAPQEWVEGGACFPLPAAKPAQSAKKSAARKKRKEEAAAAEGDAAGAARSQATVEAEADEEADEEDEEDEDEDEEVEMSAEGGGVEGGGGGYAEGVEGVAKLSVLSVTDAGSPIELSTVRLVCGARRGRLCGDLCFLLRSAGHPVVADRYARREKASLPRYCAALKAKSKPHITCVGVAAAGLAACEVEVPARLIAASWSSPEALAASRAKEAAVDKDTGDGGGRGRGGGGPGRDKAPALDAT